MQKKTITKEFNGLPYQFFISYESEIKYLVIDKITVAGLDITPVFDLTIKQDAYTEFYHQYINEAA